MGNEITLMKVFDLEKVVVDQQKTIDELACSVDGLKQTICQLDMKLSLKVDKEKILEDIEFAQKTKEKRENAPWLKTN